jgi:hypothetical protein
MHFLPLLFLLFLVGIHAEPIVRSTTRDPYSPWRTTTSGDSDENLDNDEYPRLRRTTTEGYESPRGRYTTSYYRRLGTDSGEHDQTFRRRTTTPDYWESRRTTEPERWGRRTTTDFDFPRVRTTTEAYPWRRTTTDGYPWRRSTTDYPWRDHDRFVTDDPHSGHRRTTTDSDDVYPWRTTTDRHSWHRTTENPWGGFRTTTDRYPWRRSTTETPSWRRSTTDSWSGIGRRTTTESDYDQGESQGETNVQVEG